MWNKKEMSQLDATLTRVPLSLTFDRDLWPWIFKVKLYVRNERGKTPEANFFKLHMVDLWVWEKFLAPISVTLGQGH